MAGNPGWAKGMASPNPNGRPRGSRSEATILRERVREALGVREEVKEAPAVEPIATITPLEFLLATMSDSREPIELRIRCAELVLPYMYRRYAPLVAQPTDADAIARTARDTIAAALAIEPSPQPAA